MKTYSNTGIYMVIISPNVALASWLGNYTLGMGMAITPFPFSILESPLLEQSAERVKVASKLVRQDTLNPTAKSPASSIPISREMTSPE